MTTIEKNIFIATKLLGAEWVNDCIEHLPEGYYMFPHDSKYNDQEFYFNLPLQAKDFEFHYNWNWLMLAVDEIIEIETLNTDRPDIVETFKLLADYLDNKADGGYIRTINNLFNAIVNYILSKEIK